MRINTTFLGLLLSITATAQLHIDYLSQLHYVQPLSDVWGYTAPDSSEYALVGTFTGTSIVNISDPENPEEVQFVQGAISTWYDIKTWQHYAYVVNETAGGLLIIDLSDLPNSIDTTSWRGMGLATAHNIFIDENGFAYVLGANVQNGGAIIIDLNDNPWEPEFAGIYDEGYIHDSFVRGDTMWASEIHNGLLSVVVFSI